MWTQLIKMKSVSWRSIYCLTKLFSLVFSSGKRKVYSPVNNSCVSSASSMDNPDSEMVFYLMLRAVDRFYQQHSRYPGMTKVYTDLSLKM